MRVAALSPQRKKTRDCDLEELDGSPQLVFGLSSGGCGDDAGISPNRSLTYHLGDTLVQTQADLGLLFS